MDFYLDWREIKNPKSKIPEFERRSGLKGMIQQRFESMKLGFEVDLSEMKKIGFLERGRRGIAGEKWEREREKRALNKVGMWQILDARSTGRVDRKIPRALTDIAVNRSCRPKLPESSDRETVDRMGRPATEKNEKLFFQAKSVDRNSEPVGRSCPKNCQQKKILKKIFKNCLTNNRQNIFNIPYFKNMVLNFISYNYQQNFTQKILLFYFPYKTKI